MAGAKTVIRYVLPAAVLLCLASAAIAQMDISPPPSAPASLGSGPAAAAALEQKGPVSDMCGAQAAMQDMIRVSGGQKVVGDYKVAYILEPPRGWYMPSGNGLVWRPPARNENQHIEVVILDSLTGKPLPVAPTVDLLNAQGTVIQSQKLVYLWHPQADHFAANFTLPGAGAYTIRVTAPAPPIMRHSRDLGNRFTQPVRVEFTGVQMAPAAPLPAEVGPGRPGGPGAGPTVPAVTSPDNCQPAFGTPPGAK